MLQSAYSASKLEARVRTGCQSSPFNKHLHVNGILTGSKKSIMTDRSVSDRPWKENYLYAFVPTQTIADE